MYFISRSALEWTVRVLFRLKITGHENFPDPPFIVAANHTSLLDPPIVGAACKNYTVNFMVKQELFEIPVVRHWSKSVQCIPVKRGENSIKGVRESLRRLKQGKVVGIFPEGTRSSDGGLREAKMGTGFLISSAKVPVVPIYVYGTAKAFPKGKGIKPWSRVGAVIGKAISPEDLNLAGSSGKEHYERVGNEVMSAIAGLRDSLGKGVIPEQFI
ncbi:MAG: lysophospholipid acyltransferase family protein [Candidatus Omnitrophota bacterium]